MPVLVNTPTAAIYQQCVNALRSMVEEGKTDGYFWTNQLAETCRMAAAHPELAQEPADDDGAHAFYLVPLWNAAHPEAVPVAIPSMWTVAWRKRTANRFFRVTGPALTWEQAREFGRTLAGDRMDIQVWTVPTAESEQRQAAMSAALTEDVGNVLVEDGSKNGKRVRMVEGNLPGARRGAGPARVLFLGNGVPVPAGTADGTFIVRPTGAAG